MGCLDVVAFSSSLQLVQRVSARVNAVGRLHEVLRWVHEAAYL